MSHRHHPRLAVLSAVAAGAMLLPVSAAVASDRAPASSASVADESPKDEATKKKEDAAKKAAAQREAEAVKKGLPSDQLSAGEKEKADAARKAAAKQAPRGGVAAGEAPAEDTSSTTLVGSAVGVLLLAGAGTYVLRRRSAERHTA